ncbi:MAG: FAD-dependent oxidoreductase [Oscillospiraceae bacterium]|nr:FAD-dependent oxidoreductase [Oscillospiraceae bacterium]
MVTLKIDGRSVTVPEGTSVLEAALQNGIYIPHLCHHPDLPDLASCRLCLVEQDGSEPVPSCSLEAKEGMDIHTRSEKIDALRSLAMELLLAAHPAECTGCPKFGRCELQLLIQYMDASAARMRMRVKRVPTNENPLLQHEMLRCVLCGRCVRACKDLREVGVLRYNKQNMEVYVGTLHDKLLADSDCRFCGACAEVCPTGAIRDILNYNATEKRDTLIPCVAHCPAHAEVPEYVRFCKRGEFAKANAVIHEKLPFPECLGRVCNHKCELNCRHLDLNEAVSIREIKRACAENDDQFLWKKNAKQLPPTGKKVCVIGGGPAGLTAAIYLKKQGHSVTVFEALPKLGGQLQYGIPAYRLPREVVDRETSYAAEIGVEIRCGERIDRPVDMLKDYDAVLMATGTHSGTRLPVEGNDLPGVLVCTDFLRNASMGTETGMGKRVIVLGAGNVAFDCARTAVRLGAEKVYLACRKKLQDIKADLEEIEQGKEEGVEFLDGRTFDAAVGSGHVEGFRLSRIARTYTDGSGRSVVETEPDSQETVDVDTVIFAVGQRSALSPECGLELGRANCVAVKENSSAASVEGIFACGDAVTGTKSVVEAIAAARQAASEIDLFLGGDGDIREVLVDREPHDPAIGHIENFARIPRNEPAVASPEERRSSFSQISAGLCSKACEEAGRCLQCDLRFDIAPARPWTNYQG